MRSITNECACAWLRRPVGGSRRAFTLIEVLVVVAIIALLVSILLPSLARARENTRTVQCLTNLKSLAQATTMYTTDNKSLLPGPLHIAMYRDTYDLPDANTSAPDVGFWRRAHLSYYVQRYLAAKSRYGALADRIAQCPTADRITVKKFQSFSTHRPFHYIINSIAGRNTRGSFPYYGTDPSMYFGLINHSDSMGTMVGGVLKATDPLKHWLHPNYRGLDQDTKKPKQITSIKQASREWMIADVWYWDAAALRQASRPVGTWPYDSLAQYATSVRRDSDFFVPTFPFHNATRTYDLVASDADHLANSPRLKAGLTNASFMDGHGESLRVWKGSPNPKF